MTSIYVGNLSHTATEDDLRQAFGQYGNVSTVNIVKDRETGRPRGFAFVEMPNGNEAATRHQGVEPPRDRRPVDHRQRGPAQDGPAAPRRLAAALIRPRTCPQTCPRPALSGPAGGVAFPGSL